GGDDRTAVIRELEKIEALGFCNEASIIQKGAVVRRGLRGCHDHFRGLRGGCDCLNSPSQLFASAAELAAKLGHQRGSTFIVGTIEGAARHGRDYQRN